MTDNLWQDWPPRWPWPRAVAPLAILIFVAGCATADLTPRQQAFDLMTKFEAAQIIAEAAVTDPATPENVKDAIKLAERTARAAVLAYDDAIRAGAGDPELVDYLNAALEAVGDMVAYLAANGYLEGGGPGSADPPAEAWRRAGGFAGGES